MGVQSSKPEPRELKNVNTATAPQNQNARGESDIVTSRPRAEHKRISNKECSAAAFQEHKGSHATITPEPPIDTSTTGNHAQSHIYIYTVKNRALIQ